jgi:hypothetical protein
MSPGPRRRACGALACAAACLAVARGAGAAGPLGADGQPIATSSYGVDMTQTPVLAGARVTGLAGAYVAIAEGIDANIQTPVAPAVRGYSIDHFDYELGLGITFPSTLESSDFFNTGRKQTQLPASQGPIVFVSPAANLQWGDFGVGVTLELQNYSLSRAGDAADGTKADEISARFAVTHLQAAHRFFNGQLALGAGLRILTLDVINAAGNIETQNLFASTGFGFELGALVMPIELPFRIGAAFRSAVVTKPDPTSNLTPNAEGDRVLGRPNDPANWFYLPDRLAIPWDLNVGVAVQLGQRLFNPRWTDPAVLENRTTLAMRRRSAERDYRRESLLSQLRAEGRLTPEAEEAALAELDDEQAMDQLHAARVRREIRKQLKYEYQSMRRPYLLVSTSLVVLGTLQDAVGVESFLERVVARSGETISYSPRLGAESEFVPNILKLRAGVYGEPSRFTTGHPRLHGTFGFDVRLFPWTVFGLFDDDAFWRLSGSVDASSRYLGWGVSVGVWH